MKFSDTGNTGYLVTYEASMADQEISEQAYYIEKHELPVDSDEEFAYEEVPLEEDFVSVVEEDLDTALRVINEGKGDEEATKSVRLPSPIYLYLYCTCSCSTGPVSVTCHNVVRLCYIRKKNITNKINTN